MSQLAAVYRELTERRPNLIAHPETGERGLQTLFETALLAQLDAYCARQETRVLTAEVERLRAEFARLQGDLRAAPAQAPSSVPAQAAATP